MMTDHVHVWKYSESLGGYQCKCWAVKSVRGAEDSINATEMLSAKQARALTMPALLDEKKFQDGIDALKAYAKTLAGKHERR